MEALRFFVDSVDEGVAVLLEGLEGEQALLVPLACLPGGVREGDWLCASFERDNAERECVRDEIDRLMDDLGDNP